MYTKFFGNLDIAALSPSEKSRVETFMQLTEQSCPDWARLEAEDVKRIQKSCCFIRMEDGDVEKAAQHAQKRIAESLQYFKDYVLVESRALPQEDILAWWDEHGEDSTHPEMEKVYIQAEELSKQYLRDTEKRDVYAYLNAMHENAAND